MSKTTDRTITDRLHRLETGQIAAWVVIAIIAIWLLSDVVISPNEDAPEVPAVEEVG